MENVTFLFGSAAKLASLISGITCISSFVIFFVLSLFARKTFPVRKQELYNYCSVYLLLVGSYQVFLYLIMNQTTDAAQALLYHRLAYLFGLPTIPIFLYVILLLTMGGFKPIPNSNGSVNSAWKRLAHRLWIPLWILTAVVWSINLIDILTGSDILLQARSQPIPNSFIPLMGTISTRFTVLNTNPIWLLWRVTFAIIFALALIYLFRTIFAGKANTPEFDARKKILSSRSLDKFIRGIKTHFPTVKWLNFFLFLAIIHIVCTAVQGLIGYEWRYSFPIPVYSASILAFAFAFVLIGEIVEARENVLVAYMSSSATKLVSIVALEMGESLLLIDVIINRLANSLKKQMDETYSLITTEEMEKYLLDLAKVQGKLDKLIKTAEDLIAKTGIFSARPKPFKFNDLIEEIAELETYDGKNKQFKFSVVTDPKIDNLVIDREQMRLVLRKLVENAIDALPQNDGLIEITTKLKGNRVLIGIQDNGAGIPKEYLHKIQEPFFTTSLNGNGLGLSMVQGFLDEMSGKLKIDSEVGEGTKLEITLPYRN
ncbi:hypothetical protein GWO43_16575 [candidate division KSB1 bacterium]|nr:hypothetical protein [candidate division KSB1 bacterium]NIR68748.1 hypothetical protein [candidate division KSB1 bacterium]NIS25564.1 hypothetical protein [candidate division KSB1 bacterium]NIT72458.1 hypothetical protein [candidate division KSB1 bacterium]NIU26242.1 hypothetical protein [candidate division KSB1 bacterium]